MLTEKVSKLAEIANIHTGIGVICLLCVESIKCKPIKNNKMLEIIFDHCIKIATIIFPIVNPIIGNIMCNRAVQSAKKNRCLTVESSKYNATTSSATMSPIRISCKLVLFPLV